MTNIFNLFDAVVIDLAALAWLKPGFALLPGTTWDDMAVSPRFHLINYLKGVVLCTVISLPIAALALL